MSGAIGIEQLKKLNLFIQQRIKILYILGIHLKVIINLFYKKKLVKAHGLDFNNIKSKNNIERSKLIEFLDNNGIESRPIVTGNFTKNPVIKYFDYEIHDTLNNAEILDKNGFFIGNHHYDMTKEIDYFKSCIDKFFN